MIIFKINYNKKIGKNHKGRIVTRHKEKGMKSLYVPLDLNYFNCYNTNTLYIRLFNINNNYMYRNTKLILGLCLEGSIKGEFRYILKPSKSSTGDFLKFFGKTNKNFGDINYLHNFDINDKLYNVEFKPRSHSKICMSAECSSILLNKRKQYVKIKLPSNRIKQLYIKCYSMYGKSEKFIINFKKKAGTKRLLGTRPQVRGSAMNACDHPHGGGEGKAPIGKRSIYSFTGKRVKGIKTVKYKNDTNK